MLKRFFFILIVGLFFSCDKKEKTDISIIPRPEKYLVSENGTIKLNNETRIIYEDPNPALRFLAEDLANQMKARINLHPAVISLSEAKSIGNDITLSVNLADSAYGNEGYVINHNGFKFVSIQANSTKGVFYGVQSLLQLLPIQEIKTEIVELPAITINDNPRFEYRGMHLDVSRHFFPVAFIKQYIDLMAMYKFNTFHWHLTDDQGWRIEIKKYPKLTQIGSIRAKTMIGKDFGENQKFDNTPYGGFYTQDDIREIVEYASQKNITIIPEIEMPGHSLAALTAYPEMGCSGGPYEVGESWGVFEDVYCAKDQTFTFIEDILTEVIDVFPGTYIHIGGDEVPKTRWKNCPACQKRMKTEGLKTEEELQSYFIGRIEKFLVSHNRRLIGWDEILEGGLPPEATVMSWRGTEGGIAAAKMGHNVIMTPGNKCYFDHYQGNTENEPLAIGGLTKVSEVYAYEPIPEELNADQAKHILGAQANVWTEYLPNPVNVTYMVLPRMAALAEVVWSPKEKRDWKIFYAKLNYHFDLYKWMKLNYCQSVNNLYFRVMQNENKQKRLNIESEIPDAVIHFTLNDSIPTNESKIWVKNMNLEEIEKINAAQFVNGKQIGKVFSKNFVIDKL